MGPNSTLCRQLFDAVADGDDTFAFVTADCVTSQNGGKELLLSAMQQQWLDTFKGKVPTVHYENPVVVETENGFVEEHMACITLPDGTAVRMPVVVVGVVKDGKISSMHEYFDSAAAAPLVAALAE